MQPNVKVADWLQTGVWGKEPADHEFKIRAKHQGWKFERERSREEHRSNHKYCL